MPVPTVKGEWGWAQLWTRKAVARILVPEGGSVSEEVQTNMKECLWLMHSAYLDWPKIWKLLMIKAHEGVREDPLGMYDGFVHSWLRASDSSARGGLTVRSERNRNSRAALH